MPRPKVTLSAEKPTLEMVEQLRKDPRFRAFLQMTMWGEDGAAGRGVGYQPYDPTNDTDHPYTLGMIKMIKGSTAAGKWQITRDAMTDEDWVIQGPHKFSEENQERIVASRVIKRGARQAILNGNIDEAMHLLSPEWANLPMHDPNDPNVHDRGFYQKGSSYPGLRSRRDLKKVYADSLAMEQKAVASPGATDVFPGLAAGKPMDFPSPDSIPIPSAPEPVPKQMSPDLGHTFDSGMPPAPRKTGPVTQMYEALGGETEMDPYERYWMNDGGGSQAPARQTPAPDLSSGTTPYEEYWSKYGGGAADRTPVTDPYERQRQLAREGAALHRQQSNDMLKKMMMKHAPQEPEEMDFEARRRPMNMFSALGAFMRVAGGDRMAADRLIQRDADVQEANRAERRQVELFNRQNKLRFAEMQNEYEMKMAQIEAGVETSRLQAEKEIANINRMQATEEGKTNRANAQAASRAAERFQKSRETLMSSPLAQEIVRRIIDLENGRIGKTEQDGEIPPPDALSEMGDPGAALGAVHSEFGNLMSMLQSQMGAYGPLGDEWLHGMAGRLGEALKRGKIEYEEKVEANLMQGWPREPGVDLEPTEGYRDVSAADFATARQLLDELDEGGDVDPASLTPPLFDLYEHRRPSSINFVAPPQSRYNQMPVAQRPTDRSVRRRKAFPFLPKGMREAMERKPWDTYEPNEVNGNI